MGFKKNLVAALCVGVSVLSIAQASQASQTSTNEAGWEQIRDSDGIQVWRKEVSDSPVVAFKGAAVIDASIAKVAQVLSDTSRKLEWVAKIKEARDIRTISTTERVEYNHTGTPWPIKDRDFVFSAKVEGSKEKGQLVVLIKSVEDPLGPETDKVRGKLYGSSYTLTSIEGGKKTKVVVEIHADPMGSIPKWVVNLFQKKWPANTLEGIQKQAAKADVPELAAVKAYFEGDSTNLAGVMSSDPKASAAATAMTTDVTKTTSSSTQEAQKKTN